MNEKIEVILLDIGNTLIKSVEVINGEFLNLKTWEDLTVLNSTYSKDIPIMISSVKNFDRALLSPRAITELRSTSELPISLNYLTPETLGNDRIAAAIGAWALFPNENSLIIDIGTCITIDLLDNNGVFQGGAISPGLKMRMKAMASFTDQLPDISHEWEKIDLKFIGKSTKECLLSGVVNGISNELNGAIDTFTKDFTSINVILTGGEAHFFESKLKKPIFAGSKIVQIGLYSTWKSKVIGSNSDWE
ncbi:MAG: type III pantothenate kinase [Ekhidna sp.]